MNTRSHGSEASYTPADQGLFGNESLEDGAGGSAAWSAGMEESIAQ